MKISKNIKVGLLIPAAFFLGIIISNLNAPKAHDSIAEIEKTGASMWTCAMHPQIRQPEPGDCPICAMDLIPVNTEESDTGKPRELKLTETALALADIRTAKVKRQYVDKQIRLFGKISVDQSRRATLTARFPGRIEQQYVNYTGAKVKKGQSLVKLYSPELYSAQQEYVLAVGNNEQLLPGSSAKKKLELWGLTPEQIRKIGERGTPSEYMTIYSPMGGVVMNIRAVEGDYVKTGTVMYQIADLDQLWVEMDVYESDLPGLTTGQAITFSTKSIPGKTFRGKIDFIEPVLNSKTRTSVIRANTNNAGGQLKPGMFVSAIVSVNSKQTMSEKPLVIPASAPLITGKRAVVYVADQLDKGRFQGREITLGPRMGNYYVVKSGLSESEVVVTNGNFKIDSALQIKGEKSMMNPEAGMPNQGHDQHHHTPTAPSGVETETHDNSDKADKKKDNEPFPEELKNRVAGLYSAYFELRHSLSQDDLQKSIKQATQIINAVQTIQSDLRFFHELTVDTQKMENSTTLEESRLNFHSVSNKMIRLAEGGIIPPELNLYKLNCPMAFDFQGADWLQTHRDVENPYFGSQMFRCGSVKTVLQEINKGDE